MTTVLLVRHGETMWNRERRVQGWAPSALTERGEEQARAAGRAIDDEYTVDRIVASDLRRTAETARLLRRAGQIDARIEFDPGWRERDFGRMQGLTYEELFEGFPEFDVDEVGIEAVRTRPEDGESLLDMRERVLDSWERLIGSTEPVDERTFVVVTHGGPLYTLLGHLKGWDMVRTIMESEQRNGAINEIRHRDGRVEIRRENEVPSGAERPPS